MTLGALAALLPILTGLAAGVRWIAGYFSDSSLLRRLQLSLERQKARVEVEAERLRAAYQRIQHEPKKADQALEDDLNKKFGGDGKA